MNRRQRRAVQKGRATKKAAVQVGSLNMRGYGNHRLAHPDNKWKSIWFLMKTRKLGVLALQETHLTDERVQEINEHYNKKLHVFASHNPDNPTGKGGVAIVINRRQIALEAPKIHPIVPGRAMLVQLAVHKDDRLNILVVYAPNVTSSNGSENAEFWNKIKTYYEERRTLAKPDILLGDCNMVEAGIIDRLPAHDDPEDACEALDDLKMSLRIRDGWRTTFPDTKSFTFMQSATGVQSRIDRIYLSDVMLETAREWKITESGIPNADHSLISVQITSEEAPWIGRGRWRIPDYVIKDKDLLKYARQKGIEAEQKMTDLTERSSTLNAQLIWSTFKNQLVNKAKARAKQIMPGLTRKINEHQLELERVLNDQEMSEQEKMMKSREIKTEITHLERTRVHKAQRDSRARHYIERELPSRYMSQISKDKKPRDMLYALRKPEAHGNSHD
ncbi:Endonuclease/exonuclease/phosphatase [Lentinula raphanica]|nr:Endonuclease/exonuclease/phosphatase [Lentinula raphanica]